MRKLLNILLAGTILALASCDNDKPVFDQTVSERIAQTVGQYKTALMLGEKWVLEYWPDSDLTYGGWVYIVEFKDDHTVRAWFEGSEFVPQAVFAADPPVTESEYKVEFSTAVMLKFITQNDYLHYFAFPDGSNGGYQGREGDFEFVLMSISPAMDEIVLKGSRTGNRMRMTPLSGEFTPESYLETIRNNQAAVFQRELKVFANGEEIGTMERASKPYFKEFSLFSSSKMWTFNYNYEQQAVDVEGKPVYDINGAPVYETVYVTDKLGVIHLPGGIMQFYEPYVFKGDASPGLAGQTMRTFRWTLGETSAQNAYLSTDSSIEIRLVP